MSLCHVRLHRVVRTLVLNVHTYDGKQCVNSYVLSYVYIAVCMLNNGNKNLKAFCNDSTSHNAPAHCTIVSVVIVRLSFTIITVTVDAVCLSMPSYAGGEICVVQSYIQHSQHKHLANQQIKRRRRHCLGPREPITLDQSPFCQHSKRKERKRNLPLT